VEPTAATGPRDVSVANLGPAWNAAMITFDPCASLTVL
jgi:hypothetical protein